MYPAVIGSFNDADQPQCVVKSGCCSLKISEQTICYYCTSADAIDRAFSPGPCTVLQGSSTLAPWVVFLVFLPEPSGKVCMDSFKYGRLNQDLDPQRHLQ